MVKVHIYKYNAATYVDVYQAALMRRRTPKHACLQIVLQSVSKKVYSWKRSANAESVQCL